MSNPDAVETVVARSDDAGGFKPYVPDNVDMPEFTFQALAAGTILGIVFGASSIYLVLKTGLTVSASIPVAVLSITIFRAFSKMFGTRVPTILENNIAQTAGSAGESIAFGIGVTMPVMLLLGFDMELTRVMLVAILGGSLGILMMIPLRRAFIVKLHGKAGEPGKLLYPEGTACAEVLISGEKGGSSGVMVFIGFLIAFVHKCSTESLNLFKNEAVATVNHFKEISWVKSLSENATLKPMLRVSSLNCSMAPELLGVGFIIGPSTASIMMAGAVVGYLLLVPLIAVFGEGLTSPMAPADVLISQMATADIAKVYLRTIGAGCVTAAGILSMIKTLPMIVRSIGSGLGSIGGAAGGERSKRTDRDLPFGIVIVGSILLLGVVAAFLTPEVGLNSAMLGAGLILLFGFLFVTVSSRLTGEIGSTSNPISGMTVATLSLTCLIFVLTGRTSPTERVLALSIAAIVCVAASNGGTTSQDLKTGFLVGGTPYRQQWAILIGATVSALLIGGTLMMFNSAGTVYSSKAENLPTVTLSKVDLEKITKSESYKGTSYKVWRPTKESHPNVRPGKYLVEDTGKISWLVDPGITGQLDHRDDGEEVKLKFEAPKTQVMGQIITGVLGGKLNWGLVILGAMIAVALELCGVSSLAFAVGMYIPMADTAPIFIGGLCRSFVERMTAGGSKAGTEVEQITKTETSSGVLLSSGLVAGGTIAAVVAAFLQLDLIDDAIPDSYQNYRFVGRLRNWLNFGIPNPANLKEKLPKFDGDLNTVLAFIPLIAILILIALFYRPKDSEPKSTRA